MHLPFRTGFEVLTALGTLACLSFYFLSACGLLSFLRQARKTSNLAANLLPPVSILKPLKGTDPQMLQSFCSHAEQDYPDFEIVFGVSDPSDPACEVVRLLQEEFPSRTIKLIVCEHLLGTNTKVSNLAQMLPAASHEILLVNDSDIRIPADYLQQVIGPLRDPEIGLVTCLYRAEPANTIGSRLEALSIATDFVPGVLSARFLENGLHFGLGSTLAFRRTDLASIGGFESFLDYLADDYELGHRISATGKRIELSGSIVSTFLPAYTLRQFSQHQLRWARTIRDARPWGYVGLLFTFGLPWALATLIASGGATWAWILFALTYTMRLAIGLITAARVLRDRQWLRNVFWLPFRDLVAPLIWAAGLVGSRIHWRGDDFHLKDGRLSKRGHRASI
jgi:ceramide glucosyltransferase